ncbi:MAG: beta-ketoacyl synthase N-terminal-like domain-containing protein [Phycisphaerae bacterium]
MSDTSNAPLAVTGCGWVSPIAWGSTEVGPKILESASSNQETATRLIPDEFRSQGEKLPGELKREKAAWVSALAFQACVQSAGLDRENWIPERIGMALSVAQGGPQGMLRFAEEVRGQSPRFVSPIHFPQTVGNFVGGALARAYHLRGPNITVGLQTPWSGLEALLEAGGFLRQGDADVVFAGGVDVWTDQVIEASRHGGLFRHEDREPTESACLFCLQRGDSLAPDQKVLAWLDPTVRPAIPTDSSASDPATALATPLSLHAWENRESADLKMPSLGSLLGMSPSSMGPAAVALAFPLLSSEKIDTLTVSAPGAYALSFHRSPTL